MQNKGDYMKTWKKIMFTCVLAIIAIITASCATKKSVTPAAEVNGKNDSLTHTAENPIRIWGWSRDGKTGISELSDSGGRGGIIIKTFIFDAVTDTVLWERNIDSFDYGDGYSGIPENEITAFFYNFHSTCRQLFGIEVKEVRPVAPSGSAIKHNGRSYDFAVNSADEDEDGMIRRYSVTVEAGGRTKTILSKDTFLPALPKFSQYSISPLEERALIILRWSGFSESYGFVYAGCHLTVGF